MPRNPRIFASLGLGVLLLAARAGLADTITLHSVSENPTTGVFTYDVELDSPANVQSNDGFVIYDFPGLISATLSGGLSMSQFTMSTMLSGNSLNRASGVNSQASTAASNNSVAFDSASIPNLIFSYVGPPTKLLGIHDATLTLTTSVLGNVGDSVYASVDHSGPNGAPFSFSANPVEVPTAVPSPTSWLSGAALFGLVGFSRVKKSLCMA